MAEKEELRQVIKDGVRSLLLRKHQQKQISFQDAVTKLCKPQEVIIQLPSMLIKFQLDQVFYLGCTLKKR